MPPPCLEELIFWVNYLGDNMPTFALNPSALGPGGRPVLQSPAPRLRWLPERAGCSYGGRHRLSGQIAELGPFELLTKGDELAVFAFKLRDEVENFTVFDVSNASRERAGRCRLQLPEEPGRSRRAPGRRPARLHP